MSLINPPVAAAPAVTGAAADAPAVVAPAPAAAPDSGLTFDTPAPAAPAATEAPAPAADAAAPVRPAGLPDAFWDDATGVKTAEAVARLAELETADAARRADVPADPSGYKLELAEPIIDPVTKGAITFNAEDPLAKGALAWAHENGVSQAGLSKLLGVFAQNEMAALAERNAAVAAETAKLGAAADARFAAVSAGLTKHAGEAGAKAIMASLGSAEAVIAIETVLKSIAGPSIGTPPPGKPANSLDGLSGSDLLSAVLK